MAPNIVLVLIDDLESDVSEEHDVATTHPGLVRALSARLDEWLESVDALIPRANPRARP